MIVVSYSAPFLFRIPEGQGFEVTLLFLMVLSSVLVQEFRSNFTNTFYASNRLDVINGLNILVTLLQVVFIVAFFTVASPMLGLVGLAYLLASLITLVATVVVSRRLSPGLKVSARDIDRTRLWHLGGMSWWVVVNQVGALLYLYIDLIVVNIFFGPVIGGRYAVVLAWGTVLRGIAGNLAGIIGPMILIAYARGKSDQVIQISKSAVKMMGISLALPIGLILGFSPQILTLWVGPDYASLSPLMWVLVIHLIINLAVLPLFTINIAYNKVKIPGIVTVLMGTGNLVLAVALAALTPLGYLGVALAGLVMLTSKNALFTPWYATKVMEIPSHTFTRSILFGAISVAGIAAAALVTGYYFPVTSIVRLVACSGIITVLYLLVIWFRGFSPFERGLITSYLPRALSREDQCP